jgi:uracil-DNA glycosylase
MQPLQYKFPFGQPVIPLTQQDKSPKSVFVLGVYASAVHARWFYTEKAENTGSNNKTFTRIAALAVASEPYIFWRGEGAKDIIAKIKVPDGAGKLVAADPNLNGPSGKALDDLFLTPMGVKREDAWLCDIVPHSCRNPSQAKAIQDKYVPVMEKHGLPEATTPSVPSPLCNDERRKQILAELQKSKAKTVVLLGDLPIKWFLKHFDAQWTCLGDFGETPETYGKKHKVSIAGKEYDVLPLVHPRQASKLGAHSEKWSKLHQGWVKNRGV